MSYIGRVCVAHPSYGGGAPGSHRSFWAGMVNRDSPMFNRLSFLCNGGSLLCCAFNQVWSHALNLQRDYDKGRKAFQTRQPRLSNPYKDPIDGHQQFWDFGWANEHDNIDSDRITHFAMLHDDIEPQDGWLDTLMEDLISSKAQVISAVSPIKDMRGLTSTAIDNPKDIFNPERRLVMSELADLPDIFSATDCGYPDRYLLVNTGCWLCEFTHPWRFPPFCFTIKDTIAIQDDGDYVAGVASEDWNMSRWVQQNGGKVLATKRVKLDHWGQAVYSNRNTSWGSWQWDQSTQRNHGPFPINTKKTTDTEELDKQAKVFGKEV